MSKLNDLTGQVFERLTVIKRAKNHIQPNGKSLVAWECACECGNKIIVTKDNLISKHTKSCGCLRRELDCKRSKQLKKYNDYDLSGDFGIGYTLKGAPFYFDKEDYNVIKNYCWRIDANGYVSTTPNKTLHRLVTNAPKNMSVDHINHIGYDNRKKNLRIVTQSQNIMNKSISKNNTSGTPGVCYRQREKKWLAYITVNRKNIYLGIFENKEDAIKARKEAEEKYFGEYSYENSMKGDENNE